MAHLNVHKFIFIEKHKKYSDGGKLSEKIWLYPKLFLIFSNFYSQNMAP